MQTYYTEYQRYSIQYCLSRQTSQKKKNITKFAPKLGNVWCILSGSRLGSSLQHLSKSYLKTLKFNNCQLMSYFVVSLIPQSNWVLITVPWTTFMWRGVLMCFVLFPQWYMSHVLVGYSVVLWVKNFCTFFPIFEVEAVTFSTF